MLNLKQLVLLVAGAIVLAPALAARRPNQPKDGMWLTGTEQTSYYEKLDDFGDRFRPLILWAQFCDDLHCIENCGQSVDVNDPGCMNQTNRRSIRFHGGAGATAEKRLVVSPARNCTCQEDCVTLPGMISCWQIPQYKGAKSFRLQAQHCQRDNCKAFSG